jgi:RNA polymerase sigma-70 factor (ECF subfamily)
MVNSNKVVRLDDVRKATLARASRADAGHDEGALALALREGEVWAQRALLTQYTAPVERILTRILGGCLDLDDLVQEVFLRAFERVEDLRQPRALGAWLAAIAVFVAREVIRKKQRRRWLLFLPPEELPDLAIPSASPEARAALRAFYEVVGRLDADARIAFTLRIVEGMDLTEIADSCGVSLATIKRRLARAEARFLAGAKANQALVDWLEEGTRWRRHES